MQYCDAERVHNSAQQLAAAALGTEHHFQEVGRGTCVMYKFYDLVVLDQLRRQLSILYFTFTLFFML